MARLKIFPPMPLLYDSVDRGFSEFMAEAKIAGCTTTTTIKTHFSHCWASKHLQPLLPSHAPPPSPQMRAPPPPPKVKWRMPRRGEGVQGGKTILGAFLTCPFHSEHFEYSQVRGVQSPSPIHQKWGEWGKREKPLFPGPQTKIIVRALLGSKSVAPRCSPSVWVGVSWGGGGGQRL